MPDFSTTAAIVSREASGNLFRRLATAVSVAVALLAAISFSIALFLPVYTDEIVWKLESRLTYDGVEAVQTIPLCGSFTTAVQPLLLPFRLIDTAIYENISGPLPIRLIGGSLGAIWIALTIVLLRRMLPRTFSFRDTAIAVVAISTLGVMPFLLVIDRPELPILIAITLLLIPLLRDEPPPRRGWVADIALAASLAFFCGYVLALHPRAIFALPLMLLFVARRFARWSARILSGAAILLFAGSAFLHWRDYGHCDNPALAELMIRDNIVFASEAGLLNYYLHLLWWDFANDPAGFLYTYLYLRPFQLEPSHTWDIIPGAALPISAPLAALTAVFFLLLLVAGLTAFVLLLLKVMRARRGFVPLLALGSMWGFYALSIVARINKFDYEATLMEPLMAMVSLGSLWSLHAVTGSPATPRLARATRGGFLALAMLSIANQIGLIMNYAPAVTQGWADPGFAAAQKHSIANFGYGRLRPRIIATAALCGIDPAAHPARVVVDELTYFPLEPVHQPIFVHYIDEKGWGRSVPDVRGLLTEWHSDGMVVTCERVPTSLQSSARRNGRFCCLPPFR